MRRAALAVSMTGLVLAGCSAPEASGPTSAPLTAQSTQPVAAESGSLTAAPAETEPAAPLLGASGGMAGAAGLEDCGGATPTTDDAGNAFEVTTCTVGEDGGVNLYEYDESQHDGMRKEYTRTTHVTATWAVAATSDELLEDVVAELTASGWADEDKAEETDAEAAAEGETEEAEEEPTRAAPEPPPTPVPSEPEAPQSQTEGWDVVKGDYYATVTECGLDRWGDPVAVVKIYNDGRRDPDVRGVVEVMDVNGNERASEMYFYASRVKPGQTVSVEATGWEGVPDSYLCVALDVEPVG